MNNEAFRKLLNEGGLGKTTKQIAREAVEDEFKMKRRKGKRSGYNSEDDVDDNQQKWKRKKGNEEGEGKVSRLTHEKKPRLPQYRDRAKERREGKAVDYEELHNIDHVDAKMSKYLGGDEKYTHLVKGLDTTLAEKVKRQEMGDFNPRDDIDLDKLMEETVTKTSERSEGNIISKGKEDIQNSKSSSLVLGMTSYLNSVKNKNNSFELSQTSQMPMSGQRLARTTLNFSIRANVRDRLRSWELPQESISSAAQYDRMRNFPSSVGIATPLDANLIDKIKSVFASRVKELTVTKTINEDNESIKYDSDEDIFSD